MSKDLTPRRPLARYRHMDVWFADEHDVTEVGDRVAAHFAAAGSTRDHIMPIIAVWPPTRMGVLYA